jgi:hypothetical protein
MEKKILNKKSKSLLPEEEEEPYPKLKIGEAIY